MTSDNKDGITGTGISGTVTYDSDTNTLTLNDAAITTSYMVSAANYGIYAPFGLNLKLVGANSIALPNSGYTVYGISSDESDLQISAEQTLAHVTNAITLVIYSKNLTSTAVQYRCEFGDICGGIRIYQRGTVTCTEHKEL